jgi:hypothetical protein
MPVISYEQSLAARSGFAGAAEQPLDRQREIDEQANENRSFLDLAAAALRQNNVVSNLPDLISDAAASFDDVYDPNYDPLTEKELAGYEIHAKRFIGSKSSAETQRIKSRINLELKDRETIRQAGIGGAASSIAAGLIDPVSIASMLVPVVGSGTRGVKIAKGVGASMALDTAHETALHAEQSLRTLQESAINIGAGAFVTGAFGAIATRVPKTEFNAIIEEFEALEKMTHQPIESTAGAAAVGFGTTLADETIAKGGEKIAKSLGQINPIARVITSSSKRARILVQELADVPFLMNKHLKGIATPRSAEGEIKAATADRFRLVKETDGAYMEYKAGGGGLSRERFGEEIASALRRGDTSMEPAIQKLLPSYRRYFDDSLKQLKAAGLVPEEAGVKFALSYLPRLYDHAKIKANRMAFEEAVTAHFMGKGMLDVEARTAAADVIDQVNGSLKGHAQIAQGFVGTTGPIKGRTLDLPDEVLEPWLVSNIDNIMESYVRSVTPQLVLKKKFGDLDMRQQMQDVRDEYVAMRERATSNEAKAKITEEMEKVLADVQAVRDILLNKFGLPADPDSVLVKTGRVFRAVNYMRLLGGQVLSSVPDAGRIMARHGLVKTAAKIGRFIVDGELRKLSRANAQRVGTAVEWVMNTRGDTLGDIGDGLQNSGLDKVLRKSSNTFSRLTGMASWNDALKTLAVALEQDAVVRAAKGGKLTDFQRGQLASLGVGDRMLNRIGKELESHGADIEGLFRANTEKWTDSEAAHAFEGALLASADRVVLTKGAGDVPLFMSKEIGKTLFQFKSFGMASVNRLLIPMAQGLAHRDLATFNGAWMMLALGAMANAARDTAAGVKTSTDPVRITMNAVDRAGFTTYLTDPWDAFAGSFDDRLRFSRFTSQNPLESAMGPTFGTAADLLVTVGGAMKEQGKFSPEIKQADLYRFRKLMPYQNLFYLRRVINGLEGEFGEMIGAEGSGTKTFVERVTESKDLTR